MGLEGEFAFKETLSGLCRTTKITITPWDGRRESGAGYKPGRQPLLISPARGTAKKSGETAPKGAAAPRFQRRDTAASDTASRPLRGPSRRPLSPHGPPHNLPRPAAPQPRRWGGSARCGDRLSSRGATAGTTTPAPLPVRERTGRRVPRLRPTALPARAPFTPATPRRIGLAGAGLQPPVALPAPDGSGTSARMG